VGGSARPVKSDDGWEHFALIAFLSLIGVLHPDDRAKEINYVKNFKSMQAEADRLEAEGAWRVLPMTTTTSPSMNQ
jgi:hypothetical protein